MLILFTLVWCYRNASKFDRRGRLMGSLRSARALALSMMLVLLGGTPTSAVDRLVPGRLGGPASGGSGLGTLAGQAGGTALPGPSGGTHFREGTGLAPTAGRVMLLGRRWVFVSGDAGEMGALGQPEPAMAHAAGDLPRRRRVLAAPKIRTTGPAGRDGGDHLRSSSAAPNSMASSTADGSSRRQWVLVENLMLQRIVQAIRSDSIDDSWIVTGRITEFFDDNYLILESAKRGNR